MPRDGPETAISRVPGRFLTPGAPVGPECQSRRFSSGSASWVASRSPIDGFWHRRRASGPRETVCGGRQFPDQLAAVVSGGHPSRFVPAQPRPEPLPQFPRHARGPTGEGRRSPSPERVRLTNSFRPGRQQLFPGRKHGPLTAITGMCGDDPLEPPGCAEDCALPPGLSNRDGGTSMQWFTNLTLELPGKAPHIASVIGACTGQRKGRSMVERQLRQA